MARGHVTADLETIHALEGAAESGDLDATFALALLAAEGTEVSDPDPVKARELLAWAAWRGHVGALFEHARQLRDGIGGPSDPEGALRLERAAADAGHPGACLSVGGRVHAAKGDCAEVVAWYERAAEAGDAEAALRLVQMHLREEGLPRDELRARHWFSVALVDGALLFGHLDEAARRLGITDGVEEPDAHAVAEPPSPVDEHRRLIGSLLDHDASEVFDKLEQLLDTAPQLGEALLLEMASRKMDLRGAIALLRDRVERDTLKGWILSAVTDELERLVYLAMI